MTALWFAAIKTLPLANALTAGAIGAALGTGPARIALDPTDLIALIVLWPAWRLWRGVRVETRRPLHARRLPLRVRKVSGTAALILAALATAATSPPPEPNAVTRLAVDGTKVYTGAAYFGSQSCRGYLSPDGGHSWFQADSESGAAFGAAIPAAVCNHLQAAHDTPTVACVPGQAEVCYRTALDGQVETTSDGGRSWTLAWGLPQPRLEFMRRAEGRSGVSWSGLPPGPFDPGPFDIVILPAQSGHRVVVAMGSEGVAVRDPDGTWSQAAVDRAAPAPVRATGAAEAVAVSRRPYWVALMLAFGVAWALSQRKGRRRRVWAVLFAVSAVWYCLVLNLPIIEIPWVIAYPVIAPMTALLAGAVVLGRLLVQAQGDWKRVLLAWMAWIIATGLLVIATWWLIGPECWMSFGDQLGTGLPGIMPQGIWEFVQHSPCAGWRIGLLVLAIVGGARLLVILARPSVGVPDGPLPADDWLVPATAGAFFLAAWLPFPLWAFGLIPSYGLAIGVAALGGGLVIAWGWQLDWKRWRAGL